MTHARLSVGLGNAAGHKHPLRTLVDTHIAQLPPQQLLCAGGGQQHQQLLLPVQQLIAATAGEAGAFSTIKQPAVIQQQQQQEQQSDPASFAHLPQPWQDGAQEVELVGVLAQRRR